ncbi:MAG: NifB/NifX family molybdenum-iron cluster-binding protein [Desulfobacula sp.]|jgi:predicted Fe-Mo cluster-binding NifX family protein|uniref:NifB/NifX family molybdenum-iron cluster-binding protein n=1 Tax=Desulfobacula sp. TaxID=2593537 RepID=UPI001D546D0A|nr:NifB/NifX family molybdenum-iron cluster-binding protein [Desulfobacula sp.]MBT3486704.1 NifB/NifX family molybdenum-iron cluster-binding protein [Desulfobacula sp.]MBT3805118.1 NifB/NifX family molybdenum-iron cluster-binding protein [Desulfobacula sp.]MBT4026036.1 NifB/NifX family molybdenum-iron cluster-binding protein [Desulfobacula sp.]MBT4199793.1 NifB/NifX family molybdenum-iron cluster-binding protein [Desulfobacula sp.]
MKIAITSKGRDLDSEVDPRFGRAAFILIIETDTIEFEVIDNSKNANSFKGAGIQAAASISDKNAKVLLTGFCGPNAFKTLDAANIKVVSDVAGNIRDVINNFNEGKFSFINAANVAGHW